MSGHMRYDVGDGLTTIAEDLAPVLSRMPSTPIEICAVAQSLLVLPNLAVELGIPETRHGERNIRAASDIIRALIALDDAPVDQSRSLSDRIVGTCRHFSVLSCALLRYRGIAARSRCGFATYFVAGSFVDHWIVEYWHPADDRWIRVDPEILGFEFVGAPEDLATAEFLSGGEAWTMCRRGHADPAAFGVDGFPEAWGIGEVRGNAVRDLAALNKVEMLPWDEWGRMKASYDGQTGPDYDELIDTLAATCASNDETAIEELYETQDLAVPTTMIV